MFDFGRCTCEQRTMTSPGQKGRAALRIATRSLHERLHEAAPFRALAEERLDLPAYTELLSKQASCYFTAAEILPIEPERLRLLGEDLTALAVQSPGLQTWPAPSGPAETLGWRYVVEGSIFGGRVISRQLAYLFADRCEGRSFFRGTPQGTAYWQALCEEIEQEARDPQGLSRMIEGALAAFTAFGRVLDARKPAYV